jgi:signal recognition particle GTPase
MSQLINLLQAKMLSPETKPYEMKRNKPNVVMFVGLQGAGNIIN